MNIITGHEEEMAYREAEAEEPCEWIDDTPTEEEKAMWAEFFGVAEPEKK